MFFDRHAAGARLAKELGEYRGTDAVVYALPKGGVPVGYEVAKALGLPLDIVIVQKICHPVSQDYGICAIAETGETVCYDSGLCGLDSSWLNYEMYLKQQEAKRQREVYRRNLPSLSAENKIAIIIDDGIATGITMKAAIQSILNQWPDKLIIAAPVAAHDVARELTTLADQVVTVNSDREYRGTTGAYYMDYPKISDHEIISLLSEETQRSKQRIYNIRAAHERIPINTYFAK
jgi:predicted phosphoribosyltransferase